MVVIIVRNGALNSELVAYQSRPTCIVLLSTIIVANLRDYLVKQNQSWYAKYKMVKKLKFFQTTSPPSFWRIGKSTASACFQHIKRQ